MSDTISRPAKAGSDPRTLHDFISLRGEMNKLTSQVQSEVNWRKVETLAQALFERNGLELQTVAWFALAKTSTSSVSGMLEGLDMFSALMNQQWSAIWPQPVNARLEIITGFSQYLQIIFRSLTLTYTDLRLLSDCEKKLSELDGALGRQELMLAGVLEGVRQQIVQTIILLENRAFCCEQARNDTALILPSVSTITSSLVQSSEMYQEHSEPSVKVENKSVLPKCWLFFVAGMLLACLLWGGGLVGWSMQHRDSDAGQLLTATVSPLPVLLTESQLNTLKYERKLDSRGAFWLPEAARLLDSLATLPPDWNLQYGNQLLRQARHLWPWIDSITQLQLRWQQQTLDSTLSELSLSGWHEGMVRLHSLIIRLETAGEGKEKCVVASDLKTRVSDAITHFQQSIPVEEQLRLIQRQQKNSAIRQQQIQRLEHHIHTQAYMLAQER